jgi:hypothetical protein
MDWTFFTSIRGIGMIIGTIVLLASIIIIVLHVLEKKLEKRIISRKYDRNTYYQRKLLQLKESKENLDKKIDKLGEISRDFFKEAFNLPYSLEYFELIREFKKQGKNNCIAFSRLMIELSYTGKKIKQEDFLKVLNIFNKIIQDNHIKQKYSYEKLKKLREEERKEIEIIKQKEQAEREKQKKLEQKIKVDNEKILEKHHKEKQPVSVAETFSDAENIEATPLIGIKDIITNIDECKREAEKILYDVSLDNSIKQIVEYETKNDEDFKNFISSNKDDFNRTLKIINPSKQVYNNFRRLLIQLYRQANEEEKSDLNKIIKHWNKEQKRIVTETKNPFKKQIKILQLIDEYLINIKIIASLKLNN